MIQTWTNTSQHPSKLLERHPKVARALLNKLGLSGKCRDEAMNFLFRQSAGLTGRSASRVRVYNRVIQTQNKVFHPWIDLSFRKDGVDRIERVQLAENTEALGVLQTFQCGGEDIHLVFFPGTCQNVGRVYEWHGWYEDRWIVIDKRHRTVPVPGTLALLLAGLGWIIRRKNGLPF